MHVAINRKYRRRHVQQGSVVYLALEGGSGFAGRIAAWRKRCLAEHDRAVPFFYSMCHSIWCGIAGC